jgi:hypothetical protein
VITHTTKSLHTLFTTAIQRHEFRRERMFDLCIGELVRGFTQAGFLSLQTTFPYYWARVLPDRSIAMIQPGCTPQKRDVPFLQRLCAEQGYILSLNENVQRQTLQAKHTLRNKQISCSVHPQRRAASLLPQEQEYQERYSRAAQQREQITAGSGTR